MPTSIKPSFIARALALSSVCAAVQVSAAASPYSAIYAFGDSLTDNGNLFAFTGGVLPQATDYWNGHFSNGQVAVEVMAVKLGLNLNDFAYGGAKTDATPSYPIPPALGGSFDSGVSGQITRFDTASSGHADPSGLYFLWAGSNDLRDAFAAAKIEPDSLKKQIILGNAAQTVMTNLASTVTHLYSEGARHFFLPLLPDFGLTPEGQANGSAGATFLSQFSTSFDAGLAATYQSLALPGATLAVFDTLSIQRAVYANPTAYGITNVTTPCFSGYVGEAGTQCAEGFATTAMFWDKVHPTALTHEILGTAMAAQVPEPQTMLMLALGVVLVLSRTRRA